MNLMNGPSKDELQLWLAPTVSGLIYLIVHCEWSIVHCVLYK